MTNAGGPINCQRNHLPLDSIFVCMYYSYMNNTVVYSLIHAAHAIEHQLEEALAATDLSGSKFAALSVMIAEDQPISLSDLASKLTCVRSNITQLVDRLEKDGLVKRTDDPSDRRGVRAEVTPLGRERYEAGLKATNQVHDAIAKKLSAADQDALERAVKALG
jgi:DNA-binding MarR family transcriptional regulator